jgi:MFS family permease
MILLGLFGSCASYLVFAFAKTYAVLLASRILAGLFAATIGTAQAYMADVTGPEGRGRGMALIGAAFGLGFTFGPVVGAFSHELLGPAWPGLVAAALSATAFVCALRMLPEPENHRPVERRAPISGRAWQRAFTMPGVPLVIGLSFLATFCFAAFEGTLALLTKDKWDADILRNGFLFTYVGFVLLIAQGWFVRKYLPRVGERRFAQIGCALQGAGLFGIAAGGTELAWALPVLAVAVFGFAMITPSLSSLLSRHAGAGEQGEVLGVGQSAQSLARIFGPYLGNILLGISVGMPYWVSGGLMVLGLAAALRLAPPPAALR